MIRFQLFSRVTVAVITFLTGTVSSQGGEGTKLLARYVNDQGVALLTSFDVENDIDVQIEVFRLALITVPNSDVESILSQLRASDDIEGVVVDPLVGLGPQPPVDEEFEGRRRERRLEERLEYGITLVQADQLFDLASNAPGKVDVCVVDTGIQDGHVDLPNSITDGVTGTDGFKLTGIAGTWDNDRDGHGTHCAGVIGAIGDNNKGVVGVRKNPDLFAFHIGKGLTDRGSGFSSSILEAVSGCYDLGAKVISMSLGGPTYVEFEELVYEFLNQEGFLVIAAAGNSGNSEYSYPASYPSVVSVAAVDEDKNIADFSQYNDQVELSGPGVAVLSTYVQNSYRFLSGTSMATPHVAGVAAEVWSHFPNCSNNQIRGALIRTAEDLGNPSYDVKYGHGLVQAKAAYDLLKAEGCEVGGPASSEGAKGGCEQDPTLDCTTLVSIPSAAVSLEFSLATCAFLLTMLVLKTL